MVTGGAAAELGGGAGAGAVLGGATVGLGEEPLEPDPEPEEPDPEPEEPDPEPEEPEEPEEPDEPDERGEREPLGEAVAGCPACTVGWTPALAGRVLLWCRCMAEGAGVAAAKAEVDGFVLAVVAWAVFCAAAVRANKVAKPTAAIALS